ncbi:MAG TPA: UvrD-helicase domain-containing protein [Pyrinomonadaceae bacterium]
MKHWDEIRLKARYWRRIALEQSGGDVSAEALLSAASYITGVPLEGVPAGDSLLFNAHAVLRLGVIWFNRDRDEWQRLFDQAHEYAHFWLGDEGCICGEVDLDWEASEDSVPLGAARVEGYGPHERRELKANVFAREFLLPGDSLRPSFLEGKSAEHIAAEVGMPSPMVFHQLTRALLAPEIKEPEGQVKQQTPDDSKLDPSQRAAAHGSGPILVDAGPGTGKTRALVGRAVYLLDQPGIESSQILALTFSNKAAEEMYSRVVSAVSADASQMWIGTFHAFGLELVHKHYDRLSLPAKPTIIDPLEARLMLEQSLAKLNLEYYRSLRDPVACLPDILDAISRAKDELISPKLYARLATNEHRSASKGNEGEEQRRKALRALEVAHVYLQYQELLKQNGYLDYGDLLFLAVKLLKRNRDVRESLRARYKHVLVDEYQDVNTASRLLLKQIVGPVGEGLWVVGDLRQAIYRFRGAAPTNMKRLTAKDYPHARIVQLRVNYRSLPPIVRSFELCASRMSAMRDRRTESWEVARTNGTATAIRYKVARASEVEAEEIAEEIEQIRHWPISSENDDKVSYRNQAVLCRTHPSLSRLSTVLESKDIPVLYFGNFLERPEIRDMLSLIELAAEVDGRSLHRIAPFPEYNISHQDVRALITWAHKNQVYFPEALQRASEAEEISTDGLQKFEVLAQHYSEFNYGTNAWNLLSRYLFVESDYLRKLACDDSVQAMQKRLAIYQFLQLTYALRDRFGEQENDQKRLFLDYVRRLKTSGEEKYLRQTPAWADDIDAVRLLTIHASKGLEFSAVHIPNLSESQFPMPDWAGRKNRCPPPAGMLTEEMLDWHMEEAFFLFFVALSRARDTLRLYRSRRYGKDRYDRKESPLLSLIKDALPNAECQRPPVPKARGSGHAIADSPGVTPTLTERQLITYLRCSLEYHYRHDLNIQDSRRDSPYGQTYLCVYVVWQEVEDILAAKGSVDRESVSRMMDEAWEENGPAGHAYDDMYRRDANLMVHYPLDYTSPAQARMLRPKLKISLNEGEVLVRPDYVEEVIRDGQKLVIAQRMRIGPAQAPSKEEQFLYDLYDMALEEACPDAHRIIQVVYMSASEPLDIKIERNTREKTRAWCVRALQGVACEKFVAHPKDDHCPYCPGYFLCPSSGRHPD